MLRVGLTGGIGSGKSTVARRFRELGALVIDADQLAREVVAPGSTGLAAIRQLFGDAVLAADGSLDRGALGGVVFDDPQARRDLEAITHPLIAERTRALMEAAAPGRIVVHDVPLLVELDMAASYHLTVVVGAPDDVRVARLMGLRGFTQAAARARIAAQAGDPERRAAADAWLDNNGTVEGLLAQVDALWRDRLVGFNDNLMSGSAAHRPGNPALSAYDDSWPAAAARLICRVRSALGDRVAGVEHIGATSVPGLRAEDVVDLQVGVPAPRDADEDAFVKALADKGFPRLDGFDLETPCRGAPGPSWSLGRLHGSADPGRPARLHIREEGSPRWQLSLLFRDWLRANPRERDDLDHLERVRADGEATATDSTLARDAWLTAALERAREWARPTGGGRG